MATSGDGNYVFRVITPDGSADPTENQNVSVLFDSPVPSARLYLGQLDPGAQAGAVRDGDGNLFRRPSGSPFQIGSYENEELRVGSYPVRVVIGDRVYMERVTVRPGRFSLAEWTVMEKDLDRAKSGLSCAVVGGALKGGGGAQGHIERAERALAVARRAAAGREPGIEGLCGYYVLLARRMPDPAPGSRAAEVVTKIRALPLRPPRRPASMLRGRPSGEAERTVRRAISDVRSGAFPGLAGPDVAYKKSSLIYELWSVMELVRLFEDYTSRVGGGVEYEDGEDGMPVLKKGFRETFRRGHVVYDLRYSPQVPSAKNAGDLYTVGRHCTPDMVVAFYDDRLADAKGGGFVGAAVIEVKYRMVRSFWPPDRPGPEPNHSSKEQLFSYCNDFRSSRLFLGTPMSRPVAGVVVLSPDRAPKKGLGGAVENVGFIPGRDNSAVVRKLIRMGERCSEWAMGMAKEVKKLADAGKL